LHDLSQRGRDTVRLTEQSAAGELCRAPLYDLRRELPFDEIGLRKSWQDHWHDRPQNAMIRRRPLRACRLRRLLPTSWPRNMSTSSVG